MERPKTAGYAFALFAEWVLVLFFCASVWGQCAPGSQSAEAAQIQQLFNEKNWAEVVGLAPPLNLRTADENFELGMALAHLERWNDARTALLAGEQACPQQERFAVELAGVAFELKHDPETAAWLRRALRIDPKDDYANNFAGTVYLLMGNTSAALKFWNRVRKPYISALNFDPQLKVQRLILDRAFVFSPAAVLHERDFETTQARVDALDLFPMHNMVVSARPDGNFDAEFHAAERGGFGSSWVQALIATFGGAAYETIYPSYFNAGRSAINVESLLRWDSQKLRAWLAVSGPLNGRPEWRWSISADVRDENWAIRRSFTGNAPVLGSLDLERQSLAASFLDIHSGRLQWSAGAELSHRAYHNVVDGTALTPQIVVPGYELKARSSIDSTVIEIPERRFTMTAGAGAELARMWSTSKQTAGVPHLFGKLQGFAAAHWFPQAQGDTYELQQQVRAGGIISDATGAAPFDELDLLGMERDTDLSLRGQIGTRDREKGSSPLASRFFLSNADFYRRIYDNGLFSIKAGPLFDLARAAAPTGGLSTGQWIFDVGADAKLKVFGTTVVLTYGRDLRAGSNAFYATEAQENAARIAP